MCEDWKTPVIYLSIHIYSAGFRWQEALWIPGPALLEERVEKGQVKAKQLTSIMFHHPNSPCMWWQNGSLLLPIPHTARTHTCTHAHTHSTYSSYWYIQIPQGHLLKTFFILRSGPIWPTVQFPDGRQVLDGFGISVSFWHWLGLEHSVVEWAYCLLL